MEHNLSTANGELSKATIAQTKEIAKKKQKVKELLDEIAKLKNVWKCR